MTYLYRIPSNREEQPEWFLIRLNKIKPETGWDRTWVWDWNDTYKHKISIRNGAANLVFEDEKEYTWFILQEL